MKIFQISDKRFAIGNPGKIAAYVVDMTGRPGHGGKITGVRGVKPVLDDRFKVVAKPSKDLVNHFNSVV